MLREFVIGLSLSVLPLSMSFGDEAGGDHLAVVDAAMTQTQSYVQYDPAYVKLAYPGGDISRDKGVCTDVVIRAFRDGLDFDLQKAVHEDMKANFSKYPKNWGLKRPDRNIDHRRVPNLEVFFKRNGQSLGKELGDFSTFKPGDVVTWRLGGWLAHIGIVSDKVSADGVPLIIHNVGAGTVEENVLSSYGSWINGHYRFSPDAANS